MPRGGSSAPLGCRRCKAHTHNEVCVRYAQRSSGVLTSALGPAQASIGFRGGGSADVFRFLAAGCGGKEK